jgi:hypothetical protein
MKIQTKPARFLISISRTQAWVVGVYKKLHVIKLVCLLYCLDRAPAGRGRDKRDVEIRHLLGLYGQFTTVLRALLL